MNFIELIFKLLAHFIELDPARLATLSNAAYADMAEWEKQEEGIKRKLADFNKIWWVQVINCFAGLWLKRQLTAWVTSPIASSDDDDDDDDDQDEKDKAILELISKMNSRKSKTTIFEKL